ncbi:hypothetical protein Lalb_Chr15g0086961 [Lupinus albus]|uniref:Uncharacterized protein n=1 Tax=Lupinus albus TaxID=3870 RepID=A0A6A4PA98_LUPAL|nr:hypothetical protein Lalb_Chr15g0086961 [Lupinus albus]
MQLLHLAFKAYTINKIGFVFCTYDLISELTIFHGFRNNNTICDPRYVQVLFFSNWVISRSICMY